MKRGHVIPAGMPIIAATAGGLAVPDKPGEPEHVAAPPCDRCGGRLGSYAGIKTHRHVRCWFTDDEAVALADEQTEGGPRVTAAVLADRHGTPHHVMVYNLRRGIDLRAERRRRPVATGGAS